MHRARAGLLVLLLLPVLLAGCSQEEGPPLAQPTDRIPVPTRPASNVTPTASVDFDDPGLVFNGTWQVGDEWDYRSNRSAVRQVRVVARFMHEGAVHFLVGDRVDREGQIPDVKRYVVRAQDWVKVNTTDDQGYTQEFDPGVPLRMNRNSTYFYNVSLHARSGASAQVASVAATTRYPANATLQFPWGFVETAKIEHRVTARPTGKDTLTRTMTTHYVSADFLNDVMIVEDDETWRLFAAKVGDLRRGKLLSEA